MNLYVARCKNGNLLLSSSEPERFNGDLWYAMNSFWLPSDHSIGEGVTWEGGPIIVDLVRKTTHRDICYSCKKNVRCPRGSGTKCMGFGEN